MLIRLLVFSSLFLILSDSRAWAQSRSSSPRSLPSKSGNSRTHKDGGSAVILHEVKKGETLWSIAQEYGKSVGEILDANQMSNDQVRSGMKLKIPNRREDASSREETVTETAPQVVDTHHYYTVVAKDTFYGIAYKNKVTPSELQKANPDAIPSKLQIGQKLILPSKQASKTSEKEVISRTSVKEKMTRETIQHTVGERETFYSIAKIYSVSTDAMVKANPQIRPERLRKGLVVNVPKLVTEKVVSTTVAEVEAESPKPPRTPTPKYVGRPGSKVLHVVKKGETLAIIAKQHGVSTDEIKVLNRLTSRDVLQEGDQLSIPSAKPQKPAL